MQASGITVERVEVDGVVHYLAFDRSAGTVCDEISDYALHLTRHLELDPKTVEAAIHNVKRFAEYLRRERVELDRDADLIVDGQLVSRAFRGLRQFRDTEYEAVCKNRKSRGSNRTAMATVNARLRSVAAWLLWMKQRGLVPQNVVGYEGCKVQLASTRSMNVPMGMLKQASASILGLFRRTGKKSKHKRVFVPDEDDVVQTKGAIHARATTPFQAHRDALIVDVADAMGLRRGSLASLEVGQFRKQPDPDAEFVDVTPSRQKFSYEDSYAFPVWLYERVRAFCEDYLDAEMRHRGWTKTQTEGRIFISARDGRPLADRSITHLVRKYLRDAVDAPRGAAVHAFRHKFFNDEIEKETEYRVREGLDTSALTISIAVSLKGGQKNPKSLFPYVSHYLSSAKMRRLLDKRRRGGRSLEPNA